jgi:hypothetical protein
MSKKVKANKVDEKKLKEIVFLVKSLGWTVAIKGVHTIEGLVIGSDDFVNDVLRNTHDEFDLFKGSETN